MSAKCPKCKWKGVQRSWEFVCEREEEHTLNCWGVVCSPPTTSCEAGFLLVYYHYHAVWRYQHVAAVDEAIRNVFTARDGELISHVSFNRPCGSQTNGNTEVKAFPNVWENMMLVWFHALSHEGVRLCGFVVFRAGHFCICSVSLCADSQVHRNQSYAVSVTHEHWAKHLIASSLSDRWEDLHHPQNNLSNVKLQYSH